jgi:hypothetical protein
VALQIEVIGLAPESKSIFGENILKILTPIPDRCLDTQLLEDGIDFSFIFCDYRQNCLVVVQIAPFNQKLSIRISSAICVSDIQVLECAIGGRCYETPFMPKAFSINFHPQNFGQISTQKH